MSMKVNATLVDSSGALQAKISTRVLFTSLKGGGLIVGKGVSTTKGTVSMTVTRTFTGVMPQLRLQVYINKKWSTLQAVPSKSTESLTEFGKVEIPTTQKSVSSAGLRTASISSIGISSASLQDSEKVTALEKQVKTLKTENLSLSQQSAKLQSKITNAETELEKAEKQKLVLVTQLEKQTEKIDQLQSEIDAKSPQDTLINKLFENTGEQLEQAHSKISTKGRRFKLGKVSMELKVMPGQSGNSVRIADTELIKEVGTEALSTMKIEFNDFDENTGSANQQDSITIPDLSGYTRSLAERTLKQVGLSLKWRQEYIVEADEHSSMNGRVLRQFPAAGTQVTPRSEVIVTLAQAALV